MCGERFRPRAGHREQNSSIIPHRQAMGRQSAASVQCDLVARAAGERSVARRCRRRCRGSSGFTLAKDSHFSAHARTVSGIVASLPTAVAGGERDAHCTCVWFGLAPALHRSS